MENQDACGQKHILVPYNVKSIYFSLVESFEFDRGFVAAHGVYVLAGPDIHPGPSEEGSLPWSGFAIPALRTPCGPTGITSLPSAQSPLPGDSAEKAAGKIKFTVALCKQAYRVVGLAIRQLADLASPPTPPTDICTNVMDNYKQNKN